MKIMSDSYFKSSFNFKNLVMFEPEVLVRRKNTVSDSFDIDFLLK